MNPREWQKVYAECVQEYVRSHNALRLRIHLRQLGFDGVRLETEIKYIKENS